MSLVEKLVDRFLRDPCLDEILVNGCRSLVEVRGDQRMLESSPWAGASKLERQIQEFAFSCGIRIDPLLPSAGGVYSGGSGEMLLRWHGLLRSVTPYGPVLSLRRHRLELISLHDFSGWSLGIRKKIEEALKHESPIFVMGPTGSGKTTFLAGILKEYCGDERVIILEHYSEIPHISAHWLSLVARPKNREGAGQLGVQDLFSEVLRLRPDRVVVSEVRTRGEAEALLDCLLAGHKGAVTTVHVDDLRFAKDRLLGMMEADHASFLEARNPLLILMKRGEPPGVSMVQWLSESSSE